MAAYRANNGWNYFRNMHCETAFICGTIVSRVCSTGQSLRYYLNCDTTATLVGYDSTCIGSLAIPASIVVDSIVYSVTSIGDNAFSHCFYLTGSLTIPNSVTSIGNSAFYSCSGFTGSLTIGNSVTSIGDRAFEGCSGLNGSLTIPNSVTSIGNEAFYTCSGLTGTLTIGNSVTYIGQEAFNGCGNMTGPLTIPNSVSSIGGAAFYGCSGLTGSLTLPNSLTSIDNDVFFDCSGLTGTITIPNTVTSIGDNAFFRCSSLTGSLTIPNSVTSIGEGAFGGCSGLTSIMVESGNTVYDSRGNCNAIIETSTNTLHTGCKNTVIPNTVTSIGYDAFYGCTGLTGMFTIPNSVTSISNWAFGYCSGLTGTLTIPNSVTSIGEFAFIGCIGLTSVTIPNSVYAIGYWAFYDCSGLTSITTLATAPPALGPSPFGRVPDTIPVYVPCGSVATYRATNGWNYFSNIQCLTETPNVTANPSDTIYGTVTGGGRYPAGDTATLTAIPNCGYVFTQWSDGVTANPRILVVNIDTTITAQFTTGTTKISQVCSTGQTLYYNLDCTNNTATVTHPASGYMYAWSGHVMPTGNITIPSSVTYNGTTYSVTAMDTNTFCGCSGLTSVTIPNSITSIGGGTFSDCSGLTSVTIPNSVTSIGNAPFFRCSSLTSLVVASGSTHYDSRNNCNAIIETATNTLIQGCQTSIIPNTVTTIGQYAFDNCSGLTSITIPNSVTSIDYAAFLGCNDLTSVSIGGSVTSIGADAFKACIGLTSITALAIVPPTLGYTVFMLVPDTIPVYVPCSSVAAYRAANDWNGFSNIQGLPEYPVYTDTTITVCDSYTWASDSTTYTSSGTYINSHTDADGCPVTDTLHLTIRLGSTSTETVTACNSYTWNGRAFSASTDTATYHTTNAAGCDSTATLHLTINQCSTTETTACDSYTWHGTAYTTSGTYTSGTDTLVLTINHSTTGTETVTVCNSYTWHGRAFSASTDTATYRTTNAAGCDSTATLHLTINQCSTTETTACDSYTWHGTAYTTSGTYTSGTDTLVLTINHSTIGTETVTACNSYTWHGRAFSVSTDTATYRTTNAAGCDSTATLHLTIFYDSNMVYTVSDTDSYTWTSHGTTTTYTESGTYTNSYTTAEGCAGIDTLYLTITPSPHTQYYTVSALSANASMGRASVEGDSQVEEGHAATVRATANNGYFFVRWSNGATANPYTFTVTQDTVLTAIFATRSYMVTVVNGNPGRGIVSGTGMAQHGARHNVSAAPNYGYRFSHWSDGDSNASRTITVMGDVTLTAYFDMAQFHVSAQPANYAQGTVSGGGDYDYQAYATLTATPASGYVFHHWSDGDSVNPRRLQVLRDTTLTAYFVRSIPTYTLSVTSADPTMGSTFGGGTYEEGTTATIRAAANSGYEFDSWTDGVTTNPRNVTILSDTTFTATFRAVYVPQDYTVTLTSNNASFGRVSGSGTYRESSTAYISAYPSAHCRFVRWSDGNTNAQRTLTVTSDIALTATFAPDSVEIVARANDGGLGRVVGGGLYAIGDEATLTATPNSGSRFLRWSTGEREQTITITVRYAATYTAYFERTTQGIDEAESGELRAWSHAMTIHVAGLTGQPVKVYDLTGRLIAALPNATGDIVIPVSYPGLYLVQTGTTTHKVLVR